MGIGWSGLTAGEQVAAISAYTLGLGTSMASRSLFGGLQLRRRKRRKAKARKRRR
jgi:hypothetical protein